MDASTDEGVLKMYRLNPAPSWRGVLWFFGVFVATLVVATILTPLVYKCVLWWAQAYPSELGDYLSRKGLPVYFNRVRLVSLLILFPWMLRSCGLFSWWALGINLSAAGFQQLRKGFLFGGGILLLLACLQLVKMAPVLKDVSVPRVLLTTLLSAVTVGFLEEILFRGVIFRVFCSALKPFIATLLSSLFFAYVHFKSPVTEYDSAVSIAYQSVIGIRYSFEWLPFLNLFILGVVLNLLLLRTQSIMACIGFHAGAVWVMLFFRKLFEQSPDSISFWLGSSKMVDSGLVLVLLSLIAGGLYYRTFLLKRASMD